GDRVHAGAWSLTVLGPPADTSKVASENDRSLVLLVESGARRILLTADIEAAGEAWLVESGWPLRADVALVPHHGSKSSSTSPFVRAVSPAVAVVSVGTRNSYGHPADEVLARYDRSMLYRTDLAGTVTLATDGTRLWVRIGH
ncbi:MAG: hypothetical protein C4558_04120, partial [Dehalococcoidia bacterium]